MTMQESTPKLDYDDVRCIGFALYDYVERGIAQPDWLRRAQRLHDFVSQHPHEIVAALNLATAAATGVQP